MAAGNEKTKRGRPTELTETLIEQICQLISKGSYIAPACLAVGAPRQCYYDWLEKGGQDAKAGTDSIHAKFVEAVGKAEAECEALQVKRVLEAAEGGRLTKRSTKTGKDGTVTVEEQYDQPQWLPAMTFLERRHPERWSRKDRLTAEVGHKVQIEVSYVSRGADGELEESTPQKIIEGQYKELPEGEIG